MGLKTQSKIVGAKFYIPYYIRYVTHGKAIKYSNMERNLNRRGFAVPQGFRGIDYLGLISSDYLLRYPDIPKGSEYNSIKNIPNELLSQMILDVKLYLERNKLKEGVTMTLFVYKLTK